MLLLRMAVSTNLIRMSAHRRLLLDTGGWTMDFLTLKYSSVSRMLHVQIIVISGKFVTTDIICHTSNIQEGVQRRQKAMKSSYQTSGQAVQVWLVL